MIVVTTMKETVTTIEVRKKLGDLLNRIALRHDEFIIERKGKPLAALVPIERRAQMQRFARRRRSISRRRRTAGRIIERLQSASAFEIILSPAIRDAVLGALPPRVLLRFRDVDKVS